MPSTRPPAAPLSSPSHDLLAFARDVLREEAQAIDSLAQSLDDAFPEAVDTILRCADRSGTLLVTGLGKSGLVGAKISATFASLGMPSHSVHPTEAAHGDLGRFRASDCVLAISNSGETDEVVNLAAILRQDNLPIISITGATPENPPSSLERLATVRLRLCLKGEAGGSQFVAPTSSTTATLALGDALALACAKARQFTSSDFAKRHPGGTLGGMLRPVVDVMRWRAGDNLPLISKHLSVLDALAQAAGAGRRPGALVLVEPDGTLAGLLTDGDLRRMILADASKLHGSIGAVMTRAPRTLPDSATLRDAVLLFRQHRQDEAPVVDALNRPVGMLDVQDLIALRLIEASEQ